MIAARRSNVMELVLPEANRKDFEELPASVRDGMTAHFVKAYPEIAAIAFASIPLAPWQTSRPLETRCAPVQVHAGH